MGQPLLNETPVYPRACGGTQGALEAGQDLLGLSPRLRGNPFDPDHKSSGVRSIPAPAGEPWQ